MMELLAKGGSTSINSPFRQSYWREIHSQRALGGYQSTQTVRVCHRGAGPCLPNDPVITMQSLLVALLSPHQFSPPLT